jgi:hypothetical protein
VLQVLPVAKTTHAQRREKREALCNGFYKHCATYMNVAHTAAILRVCSLVGCRLQ